MSRATIPLIIVLAWCLVGSATHAAAEAGDSGAVDPDFAAPVEVNADDGEGRDFTLHFQIGMLMRFTGETYQDRYGDDPMFVLNLDLSGLFGDPRDFAWGVAGHASVDGDVARAGLKIPLRFPLDERGKGYFQVSPGIYLAGQGEAAVFGRPGYFCEVELGQANLIALALSVEIIPYDERHGAGPEGDRTIPGGAFTNLNAGVKVGQIPGLVAGIVLVGIAAAAASSMNMS